LPSANEMKESFETGPELRMGDYMKALDDFCGDSYNTAIALPNAFGFVNFRLAGGAAPDEAVLSQLRCLGAAGGDEKKSEDCHKR